jgi:hypothetical protein
VAIDACVCRTITGADWAAMFRRHRAGLVGNAVREQIQEKMATLRQAQGDSPSRGASKILDVKLGKSESGTIEQLTTDYTDENG